VHSCKKFFAKNSFSTHTQKQTNPREYTRISSLQIYSIGTQPNGAEEEERREYERTTNTKRLSSTKREEWRRSEKRREHKRKKRNQVRDR